MRTRSLHKVALLLCLCLIPLVPHARALPRATEVQTYKSGLAFPVDMAWVPGTKKIFFTEKNSGRIRVMVGRRLLARPCVNLDVNADGERGALGIALHPNFNQNHFLYVYYTNSSPLDNRVTRFTVRNNRCRDRNHIVTGIRTSSGYHNGGQIEFAGGKLYVATGETHEASEAQDTANRLGKILRVNPDGSVPNNNPFGPTNPVWSYGHRNPFGLAHKPGTTKIYSSENGPQCDDEVNYIVRGRNYGWGAAYQCGTAGVGVKATAPIRRYSDIIVPTDMTWYRGKLKALRGLLMGDFGTGRIHRYELNDSHSAIRNEKIVFDASSGVVDVSIGPGRWLYFLTSSAIFRVVRS